MEATFEFAVNGFNMEFAIGLVMDDHPIPGVLFVDIQTEKCKLIHKHIREAKDCLLMMANVTNTVATIKFFDRNLEDSQLLMVSVSNLPDLEDQLYQLWIEVCGLLKVYKVDDHAAELCSIDTYYHELEYDEMVQADLLF